MSQPGDLHDPARDTERRDALTLAALGEPVDADLAAHQRSCRECAGELARLVHTVGLAREGVAPAPTDDVRPPDSVWNGIVRELGLRDAGTTASPPVVTPPEPASSAPVPSAPAPVAAAGDDDGPGGTVVPLATALNRRRRWVFGAVAAAAVIAAGAGGYVAGRDTATTGDCPSASAELAPVGETAGGVGGRAEIVCAADGPALRVTTDALPISTGYYEVWMYQPESGVMVAVGALGSDGSGTFTLPGGMDVRDYPVVDVSAQRYDGGPAHDRSVLQGPLTQ